MLEGDGREEAGKWWGEEGRGRIVQECISAMGCH